MLDYSIKLLILFEVDSGLKIVVTLTYSFCKSKLGIFEGNLTSVGFKRALLNFTEHEIKKRDDKVSKRNFFIINDLLQNYDFTLVTFGTAFIYSK